MQKKAVKKTEEEMRHRIEQLRNQLSEISGGTAFLETFQAEDLSLEMTLQFLENVLSFEWEADTTWKQLMEEDGYTMPAPETLTEEEISAQLWVVLQALATLHCTLDFTNHLSDRELYEKLFDRLEEPTEDIRLMGDDITCHLQILLPGDEEDDLIWLKYYADDPTRQMWHQEFGFTLPPREDPPYDRDRYLPQRAIEE